MRGRCALCRCRAQQLLYGIRVCHYHVTHGESDRACPYCAQYRLFDPRWTYTINGQLPPRKVHVRQVTMPNTIFFDSNGEIVVSVVAVREEIPHSQSWPTRWRQSVVMIGVGLQMGTTFSILQWASDWERELIDAAKPTLALAHRVMTVGLSDVRMLAGVYGVGNKPTPFWPVMDIRSKTINVAGLLYDQNIRPLSRENDIKPEEVMRHWTTLKNTESSRETVWRHNYLNVLDTSMRIFQIEWPPTEEEL